jgi:predicted nucleic acid-binding Zn ribbon protein
MGNEITTLKSALEKFLSQHRHRSKLIQTNIWENWNEIVGNTIASRTEKVWLKEGKLHIVINSSVLKNELQFHKQKLVSKVNKAVDCKAINDVILH